MAGIAFCDLENVLCAAIRCARNPHGRALGHKQGRTGKAILRLYKGGMGMGMVTIGKTLGIGTGLVQGVLAE